MKNPSCSSLLLLHYNHVWTFSLSPPLSLSLFVFFFCLSPPPLFFLQEPWLGDKQTMAPSKDVLPCKQLPLQDKLLLYPLQGVLMPVHPNHRCECTLKTSWWVNPRHESLRIFFIFVGEIGLLQKKKKEKKKKSFWQILAPENYFGFCASH